MAYFSKAFVLETVQGFAIATPGPLCVTRWPRSGMHDPWLETFGHRTETIYQATAYPRTNEVTMRDNCRGVDTFALEKVGEPVRPFQQNLFGLN